MLYTVFNIVSSGTQCSDPLLEQTLCILNPASIKIQRYFQLNQMLCDVNRATFSCRYQSRLM